MFLFVTGAYWRICLVFGFQWNWISTALFEYNSIMLKVLECCLFAQLNPMSCWSVFM